MRDLRTASTVKGRCAGQIKAGSCAVLRIAQSMFSPIKSRSIRDAELDPCISDTRRNSGKRGESEYCLPWSPPYAP